MAREFTSKFCRALAPSMLLLLLLLLLPAGAWGWQYCEDDDIGGIYGHCWDSIQKKGPWVPPSTLCCSFIGDAQKMPCVCRYLVTREVEKTISIPRLAIAARCCGTPLDPGTKCGRYTTPLNPELGEQCGRLQAKWG